MKYVLSFDTDNLEIAKDGKKSLKVDGSEPLNYLTQVIDQWGVIYVRIDPKHEYGLPAWYSHYFNTRVFWVDIIKPMVMSEGEK